ncbi:MAG: DUF554 domain-containing protein [Vallitaleaceae bacterium]|jgi:uncharacterized membrane protein YqgA involved in biofilm formation|nr:DUF554 domain-containing protein [Vallitaleaceae bacterium]
MLGTYVNTAIIIIGSLIGLLLKNGLNEKYKITIMHGVALAVLFIGISTTINGMQNGGEPILFIISLVIGGILGELIDLDLRLKHLGEMLQSKVGKGEHNIAAGFVTASLLFCVGTMAILGSLDSGLRGNHDMLYAKSVLDGVTAIILTSTLGIGVIFSAISVLVYQGAITLFAGFLEPYLTTEIIREISIIGGILIFSLGINMLEIKKIKTANLLPAILIPPLYYLAIVPLIDQIFK